MSDNIKTLSAAQTLKTWDVKLREDSRNLDVFGYDRGLYRDGVLPNKNVIAVDRASNGAKTKTISLLKDLTEEGRSGSQGVLGFEEKQVTKEFNLYADEVKHAVAFQNYGVEAFLKAPYKFMPAINTQLSKWHADVDGMRVRQALCLGKDSKLVASTNQTGLTTSDQYIHPNVFVMGASVATQPAYSATQNTYVDAITATAVQTAGANNVTLDGLDALTEWATSIKRIAGVTGRDTKQMYIVTLPPRQVTWMRNLMRSLNQYDNNEKAISGEIGRFGNLIIVEDVFAPRVTTTTGGTDTATFSFARGNSADGRATPAALTSGAGVFDVGFILGASAVIDYVMEDSHFETEKQDYNRISGIAALKTCGYNRVDWDLVAGTNAATRENTSSGLILFPSAKAYA